MDALAAAIAKKRKSTQDEFKGRKYAKRSELEEARMRKLREEEASELQRRVGGAALSPARAHAPVLRSCALPKLYSPAQSQLRNFDYIQDSPKPEEPAETKQKTKQRDADAAATAAEASEADQLTSVEVIRRLRALDQPVTLFGEVRATDATLRTATSAVRATASRPCRDAASSWTCSQSPQCRRQAAAERASLCFCTEPLSKTSITSNTACIYTVCSTAVL